MDLVDLAIKGGLGAAAAILLGLLLLEQRRHDKTREKYGELERERLAIQRDRITADNEATRMFAIFAERLTALQATLVALQAAVTSRR